MLAQTILLISALISMSILLVFSFFFFRLSTNKNNKVSFSHPVSIVICAKDEKHNLEANLPKVLNQKYDDFEVIVVNDQSTDGTIFLLEKMEKSFPNLVVVNIASHVKHRTGKKFALTLGIKTAKYNYLLLTDADCAPASDYWINKMTRNFTKSDVVLGYGAYKKQNGLLNKFIRYDTYNIAKQYLSFALVGQTYMGVGRNLAYKKDLFFENKGFASHIHVPSGDDDLFIQEIAQKNNVVIEISENAHTISEAIKSWKDWIYQKRRHISVATLYKTKFKVILSLYPYSQLMFWMSILLLFILNSHIYIVLSLVGLKLLTSYLVNYTPMKKLNVLDLYWIHPLYEISYLLIQGNFVLLNLFNKPNKWNR